MVCHIYVFTYLQVYNDCSCCVFCRSCCIRRPCSVYLAVVICRVPVIKAAELSLINYVCDVFVYFTRTANVNDYYKRYDVVNSSYIWLRCIHRCPKTPLYYVLNTSDKSEPILIILVYGILRKLYSRELHICPSRL